MENIRFLLLTATRPEQEVIHRRICSLSEHLVHGKRWSTGLLFQESILLIETGIGTVNTAHALTTALENYSPSQVIQFGIGGAYVSSNLKIGDIAIADSEHFGEMGVITPSGWRDLSLIGIPVVEQEEDDIYNSFSFCSENTEHMKSILDNSHWDKPSPRVLCGPFITVNQCSGLQAVGDEISARFNGICENMEGAAAAQVCQIRQIPFMELRGISNLVVDRDMKGWDIPLALSRTQTAVEMLISNWDDNKKG